MLDEINAVRGLDVVVRGWLDLGVAPLVAQLAARSITWGGHGRRTDPSRGSCGYEDQSGSRSPRDDHHRVYLRINACPSSVHRDGSSAEATA